jgi:hypothetical protein
MRRAFDAWALHTAQQLQGAAALAALEAAAAYHNSRLAVRAWKAWRTFVSQVCRWFGSLSAHDACLLTYFDGSDTLSAHCRSQPAQGA